MRTFEILVSFHYTISLIFCFNDQTKGALQEFVNGFFDKVSSLSKRTVVLNPFQWQRFYCRVQQRTFKGSMGEINKVTLKTFRFERCGLSICPSLLDRRQWQQDTFELMPDRLCGKTKAVSCQCASPWVSTLFP